MLLCLKDKSESVLPSSKSYKREKAGYKNIATSLPLFHEINALSIPMYIKRLDDGSGIENMLRLNNAKYHNTCKLMFNNSKLERARKQRGSQRSDEPEAGPSFY